MDERLTHLNFTAPLWEWPSRANWFFVTVPPEESAEISDQPRAPRGFGSVRVRVSIGGSSWDTSIFPASPTDGLVREYSLPIKRAVRDAEGISPGDEVAVTLELLE
ncbi:MAG TPA: DUF1905 domain-containing protein [Glaciihabitans sp.]|jgi:hypothetical protein|nr:DUF1905 domain-containing protein [Glaciihabitans sp.]